MTKTDQVMMSAVVMVASVRYVNFRDVMCFGTENMLEHKGRTKMMPSQGSSSQALGRGHRRVNAIGES